MKSNEKKPLIARTLSGIWAGVTMSWNADDSFDEKSYRENLRRLRKANVHGIYTTGSTGEFYALDLPEFKRMVDVVMEETRGSGIPIQIGCCGDDTRDVLRQLDHAASAGADGAQIVLPYWMDLTDAEVMKFFKDITAASPRLPLIHYNIPRAKKFLAGPDYVKILDVAPNLIGVKFTFAGSHFGQLQDALRLTPQISYFVGEDLLISAMQLGARGSYSSMVCVSPKFMRDMFELGEARRWDEALKMQAKLVQFFADFGTYTEGLGLGGIDPVADKGLAVASGFFVGHQRTRAPYIGWNDDGTRKVREWLKAHYPEFVTND